jgi:hypothetical protein
MNLFVAIIFFWCILTFVVDDNNLFAIQNVRVRALGAVRPSLEWTTKAIRMHYWGASEELTGGRNHRSPSECTGSRQSAMGAVRSHWGSSVKGAHHLGLSECNRSRQSSLDDGVVTEGRGGLRRHWRPWGFLRRDLLKVVRGASEESESQ